MLRFVLMLSLVLTSTTLADEPPPLKKDNLKREELPLPKTPPEGSKKEDPKKEEPKDEEEAPKEENLPVRIIRVPVPPLPEPTPALPFVYPTYSNYIGEWYAPPMAPKHPFFHWFHH